MGARIKKEEQNDEGDDDDDDNDDDDEDKQEEQQTEVPCASPHQMRNQCCATVTGQRSKPRSERHLADADARPVRRQWPGGRQQSGWRSGTGPGPALWRLDWDAEPPRAALRAAAPPPRARRALLAGSRPGLPSWRPPPMVGHRPINILTH
ncbi:unnamed protein product [Prorocentrum cordatum]|uniref:Uncharacterized protein n=1 Tax=Prorocentrum cordatum TaxID=2364126 RepID=A0ABN9VC05_9DINO|nr:unnamed protein product [Polarella glacialis]